MTSYVMEAKENLSADLIAVVDAEIGGGVQTSAIAPSQTYVGLSIDRVRRKIVYSACYVPDVDGPWTNDTGHRLWSGVSAITNGSAYDPYLYKNFSILTRSIDTDAVTRYDCWSATSTVPNGIGGSDGTARRFVEADYSTVQIPKLVDPRTGNVWSHHISGGSFTCMIYEFRLSEDYAQTISPYIPSANRHLELFGITADWVFVGDYGKNAVGRYTLELLPRVRTSDEVAADYLLSYASFDFPTALDDDTFRSTVSSDGGLYLLSMQAGSGTARNYRLYQFTKPTSAPYGGPVVGGGWSDVTPWTSSTGPNTSITGYRGYDYLRQNSNILLYQPAANMLVAITKRVPGQVYPTPTNDPLDLSFDCTYVHLADLSFTYHPAFVTGYMTAAWAPTSDPNAAAYAVLDCQEHDGDLAYHDYEFTLDYTKRWFSFMVLPVVDGVIQGSYDGTTPFTSASYRVLVEYMFASGSAPTVSRLHPEQGWDSAYTTYATAISDVSVVNASMTSGDANYGYIYDIGFWDGVTSSWWWSGSNTNVWKLNADYTARSPYVDNTTVFLKLSLGLAPGRGTCRIRYGDTWG